MGISQEPYWKVVCDTCEEPFPEGDYSSHMLYEDEKTARESVTDYDGELAEDGTVTCLGCIEEREQGKEQSE